MIPAPAFLFDLDGTLADTLPDLAASTNHVRALHELPPADDATVREFIGDGARALLRRALAERRPDERALDRAFAAYVEHHEAECTRSCRLFQGAREHLVELQERRCPIAIVTNKPERFARPVVAHLGLDAFTDVIIGGDTLPTKKPDPAMLELALHRLRADRSTATMIGDGLQDLRAGKALGSRTIGCLFGYSEATKLRDEGADAFWSSFGVLS